LVVDLFEFISKNVEIRIYRKRYNTPDHVRVHVGRLTDITSTMLCLEKNGKYRWVPRPNHYRDGIKELKTL